jgi:N-acetylglucosaminyldiphosphoundecaprenol N-acetyl-beta-D-mannosaminyltransferase
VNSGLASDRSGHESLHRGQAQALRSTHVIGTRVHGLHPDTAVSLIGEWAREDLPRMVCFANAHSLVTARRVPGLAHALAQADLCLPDGAPVAWMVQRLLGSPQPRVSGPDLMWAYLEQAGRRREPIFLYGGSPQTLGALEVRLHRAFPDLVIAGACSPPFRPLTPQEDDEVVTRINASGARTLWVGLGCPKQEQWMHAHRDRIRPVMLGVGAAFDFHAGTVQRAPSWMRASGLEWLHRLAQEPRRLAGRYRMTNGGFVLAALLQLMRGSRSWR